MSPAPKRPTAILLHCLPDGTSHFDWVIARDGPADAPLLTLRLGLRPDDPHIAAFSAVRLADHRALYLDFEGPLEPKEGVDRGAVSRLATGTAEIQIETEGDLMLIAEWGGSARRYIGTRSPSDGWRFTVTPVDADSR